MVERIRFLHVMDTNLFLKRFRSSLSPIAVCPPLFRNPCPRMPAIFALSVTSFSACPPLALPSECLPFSWLPPTAYFEIKCIILPFVVAARRLFIAKMCHIFFFFFFFFFFYLFFFFFFSSSSSSSFSCSEQLCKKGRHAGSEIGAPKSHAETRV